jgi:RNA polymerase sigma-70 factor (ECF subfamily)
MNLSIPEAQMFGFAAYAPAVLQPRLDTCRGIYEQNRHRVYSLAFWMTDNELAAEELMIESFSRAFAANDEPSSHDIDRALLAVLREYMPLGEFTLDCATCDQVLSVRRNMLRVDLERAVVELPNTEKMIFLMHDVERYDHSRIAGLLGITEQESRSGVHQARLRLRELLAK